MSLQAINRGGFLSGKKTYMLAALVVITSVMKYLAGDATLAEVVRLILSDPLVIGSGFAATFRDALAGRDRASEAVQGEQLYGVDPEDDGGL